MANLFISNDQLIKPQNEANNPYIAEAPNIRYTKPNNSITSVKAAIDELVGLISQNPTLSSIEWYYGSAPTTITSGNTGTLNKGVVIATYNNGWCKDVTNGANFIPYNGSSTSGAGSISGTTITAPTVTSDRTITIKVQYTDNGITKEAEKVYGNRTISYVAKPSSQTTYYYSVGITEVTSSNYTTANNAQAVTSLSNIPSTLDISTLVGPIYILLPTGKTPTIIPNSGAGSVALTTLTSPVSGYSYWKSARFASGATMTIS